MKDLRVQYIATDNEEALDTLADKIPVLGKTVKKLVYVSADEGKQKMILDMKIRNIPEETIAEIAGLF